MDKSEPLNCIACGQAYKPPLRSCPSCGKVFPWVGEIEEIRAEIKGRETSRIRAVKTLADEYFAAKSGGPPVSRSAVLGVLNALLLPRIVIVLGSLFGVLLLAVQTGLLVTQTRFLALQTEAAQTDQIDRLVVRSERAWRSHEKMLTLMDPLREPWEILCAIDCQRVSLATAIDEMRNQKGNDLAAPAPLLKEFARESSANLSRKGNLQPAPAAVFEATQRIRTVTTLVGRVSETVRQSTPRAVLYPPFVLETIMPTAFQCMLDIGTTDALAGAIRQFPSLAAALESGSLIEISWALHLTTIDSKGFLVVIKAPSVGQFLDGVEKLRSHSLSLLGTLSGQCWTTQKRDLDAMQTLQAKAPFR